MTDDEKQLDKAAKHSALGVLGAAVATSIALFGLPFFIPLVSIPLWGLGVVQRFTERPWLAAGAVAWAAALAVIYEKPLIGVGAAGAAYFFTRHLLLHRKLRAAPRAGE